MTSAKKPKIPESDDWKSFMSNFKTLSMHFAEAFLTDLSIRNYKMEGAASALVIKDIRNIVKFENESDKELKEYFEKLDKYKLIQSEAFELRQQNIKNSNEFNEAAKVIEEKIFGSFKELPEYRPIPISWNGPHIHAMLLILERTNVHNEDMFDMAIINTGMGINYHQFKEDVKGIAPKHYRPWKKYSNIPLTEFTDGNHWFVQALGLLWDAEKMKEIEKDEIKPDAYFYETILGNFEKYKTQIDPTSNDAKIDDRYIRGQLSGSCTYSSLMAGILYHSNQKSKYLKLKFILGTKLLKEFYEKFGNSNQMKELLKDANEPMTRYLLKLIISGVANQALELLDTFFPIFFKKSPLFNVKYLNRSTIFKLKKFKDLNYIKEAIEYSIKIRNLLELEDNKLDLSTSKVIYENNYECPVELFTSISKFKKNEFNINEKIVLVTEYNWPGAGHPYLKKTSSGLVPEKIENVNELIRTLNAIHHLSKNADEVGPIMDIYMFDLFKAITKDIESLVLTATENNCSTILFLADEITKNFIFESYKPISLDGFAAWTELFLLTWEAAKKYDSYQPQNKRKIVNIRNRKLACNSYLGLHKYNSPFFQNPNIRLNSNNDPNGDNGLNEVFIAFDTCAAYPEWLTTESDYEAWIRYQNALDKLRSSENNKKQSFFDPNECFLSPKNNHFDSISFFDRNSFPYEQLSSHVSPGKENVYSDIKDISLDNQRKLAGFLGNYEMSVELYPHFHHLVSFASSYYFGPWRRPTGHPGNDFENSSFIRYINTAVILPNFTYETIDPKNAAKKDQFALGRDRTANILLKNIPVQKMFLEVRSSETLQEPQNVVRLYSYLSFIEGLKSCAFFSDQRLVFIGDRLFGYKTAFGNDENLIYRVLDALKEAINGDMNSFHKNFESFKLSVKERRIDRMLQASMLKLRLIIRVKNWNKDNIDDTKLIKAISELYNLWQPIGSFKWSYSLSQKITMDINVFLLECVKSSRYFDEKLFSESFKEIITKVNPKSDNFDSKSLVKAHIAYRLFLLVAFKNYSVVDYALSFNLVDMAAQNLRHKPQIIKNKETAEAFVALIKPELLLYFDPNNKETISGFKNYNSEALDEAWTISITKDFDLLEMKHIESTSKIPFIIAKISIGRIILNGVPQIPKYKIFENALFRKFFSEEDLIHAYNGETSPIGENVSYKIENFRGSNQNYLFVTDGLKDKMDIYYYFEKSHWLWLDPKDEISKEIAKHLRFFNFKNIKMFYKFYDSLSRWEVIFIKNKRNAPVYRLVIEKASVPDTAVLKLKFPHFEEPIQLLKNELVNEYLPYNFENFAVRPEFVSMYRNADSRSVIVYGPYRLESDQYPIIFQEALDENGQTIFKLLNMKGWCLDEFQAVNEGLVISRTLKIRSMTDPSDKALLIPKFRFQKEYSEGFNYFDTEIIEVILFKLSNDNIIPANRYEKLVLTFILMQGTFTDQARKLLNPIRSMDNNSVFDEKEIKVLNYIIFSYRKNPEVSALKLMAAMNYFSNMFCWQSVFKLDYKVIKSISFEYLSSLSDLSDKYYLHRIFPEITNDSLFKIIFTQNDYTLSNNLDPKLEIESMKLIIKAAKSKMEKINQNTDKGENDLNIFLNNLKNFDRNNFRFSYPVNLEVFMILLDRIKEHDNYVNISRLFVKNPKNNIYMESFIMNAIQYFSKVDPVFFLKIKEYLNSINDEENYFEFLNQYFIERYVEHKSSLVLSEIDKNAITNIEKTIMIFSDDLKSRQFSNVTPSVFSLNFIDNNNLKLMVNVIELIIKYKKTKKLSFQYDSTHFSTSSPIMILSGLTKSIENFIKEDIIDGSLSVNLNTDENAKILLENIKILLNRMKELVNCYDNEIKTLSEKIQSLSMKPSDGINLIADLDQLKNLKKKKTFNDLYGCYFSFSLECIRKKFPDINRKTAKQLRKETFKFYSINVLNKYLISLIVQATDISRQDSPITLDKLDKFLIEAKKFLTFNGRVKNPGILNFEYLSDGLNLKDDQVVDLESLTKKSENNMFISTVIQRIMAAGKTLVLGTLGTVLKAREPDVLSILVPPSSLFQSNSASMQSRTYKYFKSRGVILNFKRLSVSTAELSKAFTFLEQFHYNLIEIIKSKNYLIISPDSLQSFLNSYIEMLDFCYSQNLYYISILKKYAEIYKIFREKGAAIFDEIDMTMDPKKELNYPTTRRESFNLVAVVLTADLFEFSIFSEGIKKAGLNLLKNNQASLTLEKYEEVKNIWLKYIEKQLDNEGSLWHSKLLAEDITEFEKSKIMEFLRSKNISEFSSWSKQISTKIKTQMEALIIIKKQIDFYIKDAFKNTVNEHFGPAGSNRPEIKYAVPYVAANTPSEFSLFADRWETLNKTLLMIIIDRINNDDLLAFISWLKSIILSESNLENSLQLSATYKIFEKLIPGINPLLIDNEDAQSLKKIRTELGQNSPTAIRLLFSYFIDSVISKIGFPTEQISSNALHMASIFASVQGYSGTIDNVNILPSRVVPAAHIDHNENEKHNGGIVVKLLTDHRDEFLTVIPVANSIKKVKTYIKKLMETVPDSERCQVSALIDVGAFLKNFKNAKIAEAILKYNQNRIRCVLYYDEFSNMLQFVSAQKNVGNNMDFIRGQLSLSDEAYIKTLTGCEVKERFTFYDQRHITGSDIPQPIGAIGILTAGSRNLLRDILQGSLRMRQFMTNQKIKLIVTGDVIEYFNGIKKDSVPVTNLKAHDVIYLGAFNEEEKQLRENSILAFTKIDVEIRSEILNTINNLLLGNNENVNEFINRVHVMYSNSRKLFIRSFSENPLSWLLKKKNEKADIVIKNFINKRSQIFTSKNDEAHYESKSGAKIEEDILNFPFNTSELNKLIAPCDPKTIITESVLCYTPDFLPEFDENSTAPGGEMRIEMNSLQLLENEVEILVLDDLKRESLNFRRFQLAECNNLFDETNTYYLPFIKFESFYQMHKDSFIKKLILSSLLMKDKNGNLENFNDIYLSSDLVFFDKSKKINLLDSNNREGTHFFVVKKIDTHKIMLISSDVADEILQADPNACVDHFWYLTDLTGYIIAKNEFEKIHGINIFELIPESKIDFFNLLLFNGSLLQLISQPNMKEIFLRDWIPEIGFNNGLSFLMKRMKVLQNKTAFMFDEDDSLIKTINEAIAGDINARYDLMEEKYYDKSNVSRKDLQASSVNTENKNISGSKPHSIYDKCPKDVLSDCISIEEEIEEEEEEDDDDDDDESDFEKPQTGQNDIWCPSVVSNHWDIIYSLLIILCFSIPGTYIYYIRYGFRSNEAIDVEIIDHELNEETMNESSEIQSDENLMPADPIDIDLGNTFYEI